LEELFPEIMGRVVPRGYGKSCSHGKGCSQRLWEELFPEVMGRVVLMGRVVPRDCGKSCSQRLWEELFPWKGLFPEIMGTARDSDLNGI